MSEHIIPGRYQHFRGNEYQVIGTARHSETDEIMVVYRCLYGDYGMWVRPLAMFNEAVETELDGVIAKVPRFRLIAPVDDRLADSDGLA